MTTFPKDNKGIGQLLSLILVWRVIIVIFVVASISILPLQNNFIGGGVKQYLGNPLLWSSANFDGEHYLSIAQRGYGNGEQAFFPLYPLIIKYMGGIVGGLIVNHIAFFVALVGLYLLIKRDHLQKVGILTIGLLLIFPTSFYFVSLYTESLFLALSVWAFYFAREKKWIIAGLFTMFASGTRVVGLALIAGLVVEYISQVREGRKLKFTDLIGLAIMPIGIIAFMFYLNTNFNNPFAFITSLSGFGEQRSTTPIILPQVFFRYFVRILPNLNYSYWPNVFTTYLEVATGVLFSVITIYSFFKNRLSYSIYLLCGFLLPTLSGSFSSLPRYVLVLFPGFILMGTYVQKLPKMYQFMIFFLSLSALFISTILFSRGYWLS